MKEINKNIYPLTVMVVFLVTLFTSASIASGWVAPSARPPQNNTPAPINVGVTDQNKQGKLGLSGLVVFGNFQLKNGTEGEGKVLVSDANGKARWVTLNVGQTTTNVNINDRATWVDVPLNTNDYFDTECEYRTRSKYPVFRGTELNWSYPVGVTRTALTYPNSNDSKVTIPNTDKTQFYITPYGPAGRGWGYTVVKMEKRC